MVEVVVSGENKAEIKVSPKKIKKKTFEFPHLDPKNATLGTVLAILLNPSTASEALMVLKCAPPLSYTMRGEESGGEKRKKSSKAVPAAVYTTNSYEKGCRDRHGAENF